MCHCPIHAPCDPKRCQDNSAGGCWSPGSGSHFVCHNSGSYIIHITFLTGQVVRYQCLGDSHWHEQVLEMKILQVLFRWECGVSPGCWMKSSSKQVCSEAPEWHSLYPDTTWHASAKITDIFSKLRGRHKIIGDIILILLEMNSTIKIGEIFVVCKSWWCCDSC